MQRGVFALKLDSHAGGDLRMVSETPITNVVKKQLICESNELGT